jgi:hypothetical protein
MRRFAFLGAAAALLFSGAVVLAAASPSPSPSGSARPTATPTPSTPPSSTPSAAPNGATKASPSGSTFSAQIQPVQISGSATVSQTKNGAEVILRVTGLMDAQRWTVDIDGGTLARPNERIEIAHKTGLDVTRLASDTVRIHLTSSEMAAFLRAEKSGGVVALVSDGSRLGAAEFTAG